MTRQDVGILMLAVPVLGGSVFALGALLYAIWLNDEAFGVAALPHLVIAAGVLSYLAIALWLLSTPSVGERS